MERRTLLKLGAGALAASALGGGLWVRQGRRRAARRSARITGEWEVLGNKSWLLPDLRDARMVVPDRPHSVAEALDDRLRARIHRTRSFRVSTNHRRLRSPAFEPRPAPGVRRLLVLGDSVTFGWGVEGDQTTPARLQATLTGRGHRVEVINGGVPAVGSVAMTVYLRRVASDLGLHGVVFNRRPYPHEAAFYVPRLREAMVENPGLPVLVVFNPLSSFETAPTREKIRRAGKQIRKQLTDLPVYDLDKPFRSAGGRRGVRVEHHRGRDQLVVQATGQVLVDVPAADQTLDAAIYQALEADPSLREPLLFDQGHPDAEGHEVYAGLLADRIEGLGWLG